MYGNSLGALTSYLATLARAGGATPYDLWLWMVATFLRPGEYLLEHSATLLPRYADAGAPGGVYAFAASTLFWLFAIVIGRRAWQAAHNGLRVLHRAVQRRTTAVEIRMHLLGRRFARPIRTIEQRLRPSPTRFTEEFRLDELQMAVLRAHVRLPPGHVITAIEVATDLGVRPMVVQQALEALKKMHLVEVTFGTTDEFPGYLLTRPGEAFLSMHSPPVLPTH